MADLHLISCQVTTTRNPKDRNTKITRAMPMDVMIKWNHVCETPAVLLGTEWIIRKCLFLSSPLLTNTVIGLGINSCREQTYVGLTFRDLNSHTVHITHYLWNLGIHFISSTKYIYNYNFPTFPMGLLWRSDDFGHEMMYECKAPLFWSSKALVVQTSLSWDVSQLCLWRLSVLLVLAF